MKVVFIYCRKETLILKGNTFCYVKSITCAMKKDEVLKVYELYFHNYFISASNLIKYFMLNYLPVTILKVQVESLGKLLKNSNDILVVTS